MPNELPIELRGASRCDVNAHIFLRDNYTCVHCGFDGRSFPNWMQLTVDHKRRVGLPADENDDNKVTCCPACNSMAGNVGELKELPLDLPIDEYFQRKKEYVKRSRKTFFDFWPANVAPSLE